MPTVNVKIQPTIISWAMSQTSEEQLGTKLLSNIQQWLSGTKTPTFNQIETFSRKANIPLGYFFLQTPPVEDIKLLEEYIDEYNQKLPPLKYFILPGDEEVAAHFHVARTVVRRAERRIVSLAAQEDLNPLIQKYVNRLSDLMFVLARYSEEVENKKWKSTNLNI